VRNRVRKSWSGSEGIGAFAVRGFGRRLQSENLQSELGNCCVNNTKGLFDGLTPATADMVCRCVFEGLDLAPDSDANPRPG